MRLELESVSQSHIERQIVASRLRQWCWFQEIRIWRILAGNKVEGRVLVWSTQFLTVENVEEVSNKIYPLPFFNTLRAVGVKIEATVVWRTPLAPAPADRNLTHVQVHGMRIEFIDRKTGLEMEIETKTQAVQPLEALLLAETITTKQVDDVSAVGV